MAAAAFEPETPGLFGKVGNAALRSAEYVIVKGQFVAPGRHRMLMAGGLSAGLFGGRALMDEITGRHPDGTPIDRENVPFLLRPLYGRISYNPYSDHARDRWLHTFDNLAPGIFGAIGVAAASRYHFKDRISAAELTEKIAQGLEVGDLTFGKIEQAIAMRHARPFAKGATLASLQGSASGANLSPTGYGPMLSALFSLRADRKVGMGRWHPLSWLTDTKASSPHGMRDMMTELWRHMLFNHEAAVSKLHEMADLGQGAFHTLYKNVTPELEKKWLDELAGHRSEILDTVKGKDKNWSAEEIGNFADQSLRRLERLAIREGLTDMTSRETVLKSLDTGTNGFLGWVAERDPHTKKMVEALRLAKAQDIHERHFEYARECGVLPKDAVYVKPPAIEFPKDTSHHLTKPKIAAGATALAAAGAIAYGASHDTADRKAEWETNRPDRAAAFINGSPLHTAEWISNSLNFPPGLHRLENALGLSAGMYAGMKLGEAVTGWTLGGRQVSQESLIAPLRMLHGKAWYNPFGISTKDRWMKVGHYALPAIGGFYGTKFGSDHYFAKQRTQNAKAEFIDDYARKISYDQSVPWGYLSAGTALANVGLGVNFLPVGYGMNLGNRFTLGTGRKVVLPGLKEIVSNNHSVYPLGPTALRDYAIEYLVKNPDPEPKQIGDMSRAILTSWFGEQPASRIDRMANDMLDVRKKYLGENGIPEEKQEACRKELKKRFSHQGLHDELQSLGLDVMKANIADNGLIGDIGNALGARKLVRRDVAAFRDKEIKRRLANDNAPYADNDEKSLATAASEGFAGRVGKSAERKGSASQAV